MPVAATENWIVWPAARVSGVGFWVIGEREQNVHDAFPSVGDGEEGLARRDHPSCLELLPDPVPPAMSTPP